MLFALLFRGLNSLALRMIVLSDSSSNWSKHFSFCAERFVKSTWWH